MLRRPMIFALFVSLFVLMSTLAPTRGQVVTPIQAEGPVDIGSRLELLVDEFLIDSTEGGVALEMHRPTPREVVMVYDRPWEGSGSGYHHIFKDGDLYRMYYKAWRITLDPRRGALPNFLSVAYAESDDGITWRRPNLGLFEYEGSTDNNIVLKDIGGRPATQLAVFRDDRAGVPDAERYKAVGKSRSPRGLAAFASPDGIHWTQINGDQPVMTGHAFDSHNLAFWDPNVGKYRAYVRDFRRSDLGARRCIRTGVSDDLVNWSERVWLRYPGAADEQLYTNNVNPYFRAPHIYVGFPARYVERTWGESFQHLPNFDHREMRHGIRARYGTAVTDSLLMTSRDGVTFKRWPEAFLRPGARSNNWAYGDNFIGCHVVPTRGDERGHDWELSLYATEDYFVGDTAALRRYTLRLDGFVSMSAAAAGGTFTTRPLIFAGDELVVNFETSAAGRVVVELLDAAGRPIPGFAAADADELFGDETERVVSWRSGESDVSRLAGRPIRMRVTMSDADLYSFRFRDQGASLAEVVAR